MAPLLRNREGLVRLATKRTVPRWRREAWLIAGLLVACVAVFGGMLMSH